VDPRRPFHQRKGVIAKQRAASRPAAGRVPSIGCVAVCALLSGACGPTSAAHEPSAAPPPTASAPPQAAVTGSHATPAADAPASASAGTATKSRPAPPAKLNVIVITVDAMRSDMPWAGYPRPIAPHLTKLEGESVSYTRAYALSSYTAMSMGGFLAGRYPGELKRSGYFFSAYPDDELLFPEVLQQQGVRTLSAHAHFYFEKKAGFHQGFDDYRIVPGIKADNTTDRNVTSPAHLKVAIDMLSQPTNTGGQFFAWFHFMDPHDVYVKHEGFESFGTGKPRDRYDGEMLFTDHHLGKLFEFIDAQPWGKHTAIVISADHGEAFGEHRMTRHGFELWEPLVHVPMFFRVPGVAAQRIDTPRSHIDLAPTIFELMGLSVPEAFQGSSLVAEMKRETKPELRDVVVDLPRTSDNFRRRALVHDRHKIIAFGDDFRYQLYDVVADPGEKRDLRKRDKPLYERMKKRYLERVKTIKDICPKMRRNLKGRTRGRPC
jgi:arylsulfatase A-like enzyme